MSEVNDLFLYLQPGADPAVDRVVQDLGEAESLFVWVPDGATAARVAAEEVAAGVTLIELYRGFDLAAAGQVIEAVDGRAAVGLAGFAYGTTTGGPVRHSATIFVGHASADPAVHRLTREHADGSRTTAVSTADSQTAVAVAKELASQGVELIELCGGSPLTGARDVRAALGGGPAVSLVSWPFESLERVAAYKAAFEAEHAA